MSDKISVRFAPSPTGFLHLGSARTALVNWVYAKHTSGDFLLRIEDTDLKRSKKEFLDEILADLEWMGLDWEKEPVHQGDRFDLYRQKAEEVLASGKAYKEGEAILYKVEKARQIDVQDLVHGKITFNTDQIKDQVLIKSDGSPAYNFCCVVDDAEMGVSHVIRGDDHISNTPKQLLLYEALKETPPLFAHMPLMMGPDGAKLSKRHGAVAVDEYKKQGILPEALVNYLLLLGWAPRDEREVFSLDEAIEQFDIKDMKDVQVRFDFKKLRWLNGEHIKRKAPEELSLLLKQRVESAGFDIDVMGTDKFSSLVELYRTRIRTLEDFPRLTECFFTDDYEEDEKGVRKHLSDPEDKNNIKFYAEKIEALSSYDENSLENSCRELAEEKDIKAARIIHPTRMAISGKTMGAGLFEMMDLLGKQKVLERLNKAALR